MLLMFCYLLFLASVLAKDRTTGDIDAVLNLARLSAVGIRNKLARPSENSRHIQTAVPYNIWPFMNRFGIQQASSYAEGYNVVGYLNSFVSGILTMCCEILLVPSY
ncbi:hypothetical protein BJ508DRAFT_312336 [Ascobolus immersus RN42]|uniref:Uncharacterized protein n=1 Tax=Ascobolus immersus RN42 TaxID=1160509 RepID=A0A3N4HP34_ASCIM|nr:hypothetical protein BJ508DRAFT_312336 [Ascobolus immersus RN42]